MSFIDLEAATFLWVDLRDLFHAAPGHALTAAELRPYLSNHQLAKLVGSGAVRYDGRGVYWLKQPTPDLALAKQLRGVISHRSAAQYWRLQLVEAVTTVEITIDPGRRRVNVPDGVRVYHRSLRPHDRDGSVTTVTRTLLDCARDLPTPETLAIADDAVARGEVDLTTLAHEAANLRGPRSTRARQVISWIDPRAHSVLESATRGVILDGGITGFVPQFPVTISTGEVRHADLGHEQARLLIEAEGLFAHTGGRVERDMIRYNEFAAAGYSLLRFSWSNIMHRRPWVVQIVRGALEQRLT